MLSSYLSMYHISLFGIAFQQNRLITSIQKGGFRLSSESKLVAKPKTCQF